MLTYKFRYHPDDTDVTNLILIYDRAELPSFVGTDFNAPFDLKSNETQKDLFLYLKPEQSGFLKVRIDFDFDRRI